MSRLDDFLAAVAPGLAARRLVARAKLAAATRLYEAVSSSTYRPKRGSGASADLTMDGAKGRLREYGRWLDENHDMATGVLDDLVANIVGVGVGIEPMVRRLRGGDPILKLNTELRGLWDDFWRAPELTGELPGPELERLVCRSWLRDGEVFVQHVTAPLDVYPGPVQYLLQVYESDWVPFDLIDDRQGVVHGVQKDRFGRPRAYFIHKEHPGDRFGALNFETIPVSADNLSHIKFTRRLHQTRGVSVFHSVFTRLDDLKDYEESERVAARVAAAFSAYIKRGNDYDPTLIQSGETDRTLEMAPGMIFDSLLPGEEIGTIDPNRPNNDIANYIAIQERRIAAGTGSRRSAIGRDYNGTYSSQRQELVEGAVHYRRLFSYLSAKFYLPVWRRFVDQARVAGILRISQDVDLRTLYRPELRQQPLPWIDPKKELEAHGLAVEKGFRSRYQVIRDLGGDPREVDAQLAADPLDVRPPVETAAPPTPKPAAVPKADDDLEEAA